MRDVFKMEKTPKSCSVEVSSQDLSCKSWFQSVCRIDGLRIAMTVLALFMSLTVLAVSGHSLAIYNRTQTSSSFLLDLWPADFDIRPTVALVTTSSIVLVTNIVTVVASKVNALRATPARNLVALISPLVGLFSALAATIFYAVKASDEADNFLNWTCRWRAIPMARSPHFGRLCSQSYAGLYLAVLLVPVELIILGLAGWQFKMETYAQTHAGKTGSVQFSMETGDRMTPSPTLEHVNQDGRAQS